jgi:hypothetical protein
MFIHTVSFSYFFRNTVKRLYQTQRQKLRRELRGKDQKKSRENWKKAKKKHRRYLQNEGYTKPQKKYLAETRRKAKNRFYLRVPEICSFVQNSDEFIAFIEELGKHIKQKKTVQIDFRSAKILTSDVFTVLLSKVYDERFCPDLKQVLLFPPEKGSAMRAVWDNSGMASKLVIQSRELQNIEQQGEIINIGSKEAAPTQSLELIQMAMEKLYRVKQDCQPVRSILGELTLNTHEHASGQSDVQETWWVSAYYDKSRTTVCFSFVDNGLGIFETAKTKELAKFYGDYPLFGKERSQILKDIFTRNIPFNPSETGFSFRGKGLPHIYRHAQWNYISNLTVVTNDVCAKIAEDNFCMMKNYFSGTFFYWEYSDANRSN